MDMAYKEIMEKEGKSSSSQPVVPQPAQPQINNTSSTVTPTTPQNAPPAQTTVSASTPTNATGQSRFSFSCCAFCKQFP